MNTVGFSQRYKKKTNAQINILDKQPESYQSQVIEFKNKINRNVDPFQRHFELNMNVILLTIINPIINKKKTYNQHLVTSI